MCDGAGHRRAAYERRFEPNEGSRMSTVSAKVLGPDDGRAVELTAIGVRFMIGGDESGGGFALVEHPMPPRALAGPLHRHSREDEYSFVLAGRIGALLGEELVYGGPGALIFKPRQQWHTFWNASDEMARVLEIISPAGFERYFGEMAEIAADAGPAARAELGARYGLEVDPASIPRLCEQYGLVFGRLSG
jgi:quercetin dioxygenase-like cupin family protein